MFITTVFVQDGESAADVACANADDESNKKEIHDYILFFIPNKTFKEKL